MQTKSLCLTTYVFGEKYHYYIPILLYSLLRAYPNYHPIIFVKEHISSQLSDIITSIEHALGSVTIIQGFYEKHSFGHIQKGKSVRWVLDHSELLNFDYCYFVDIDMFYVTEQPSLLTQHIKHSLLLNLPYSNIIRRNSFNPWSLRNLKQRVQSFGLLEACNTNYRKSQIVNMMSGLHFVKCKEYYYHINKVLGTYKDNILSGTSFKHHPGGFSNECLLYDMVQASGIGLPPYLKNSGPHWLDYHRFNEIGFRPHHGLHLGIFRSADIIPAYRKTLLLDFYLQYYRAYRELRQYDELLEYIINSSPSYIQNHFVRLEHFYESNL